SISACNLPYDLVRLPSSVPPKLNCHEGDLVEAHIKCMEGTGELGFGWVQARVLALKGDFVVLDLPSSTNTKDIVSLDKIRPVNRNPNLTYACFKTTKIEVPEDMRDYSQKNEAHLDFQKAVDNILVTYDSSSNCIII
uniref:Synaptic functional regulator FMRP KH0 domain-containing protein n=1 Tax=Romanomermis culicivorax TaxID=13658 RepID=A0A915JAI6_ROMCU